MMEIKQVKYSLILFFSEIFIDDINRIEKYIEEGIIIHILLSNTLREKLIGQNRDVVNRAIKNNLLSIYEVEEELLNRNEIIAIDGEIVNTELYDKLCRNTASQFNNQQYEIVTSDENSNYIIISGAGTGKTTTMINRLMYLRKKKSGFTFDKAALITFTNKASREMREKLIKVLERYYETTKDSAYLDMMDEAARCTISTIHGFSKKLINKYGKNININKNIKVRSFKYLRKKAITESLNDLYRENRELYDVIKYYPHYDVEAKLLAVWDKLDNYSIDIKSENYNVDFGNDDRNFSKIIKIVIEKAQEYLEQDKGYELEIADLMKKLSYKELFYEAKGEYDLIMVDEFQDSDNIQIDFVASFCNVTGANLMVVGDEKQSIYRFRGAEHTAFSRLRQALKSNDNQLIEFGMVRNYRTDSKLLSEINDIFININSRVDKFKYEKEDYIYSLVNKDKESKIKYISLPDYNLDAANFYHEILKNYEGEYVAVLFRSNSDIKEFKDFCDKNSIPCRVDVSGSFYRHEAVRDFYIMIKALINSTSNSILYSFIETPYINRNINKEIILTESRESVNEYLSGILSEKEWSKYIELVQEINILEVIDLIVKDKDFNPIRGYYCREYLKAKVRGRDAEKIAKIKTLEYKLNLEHLLYLIKDNFSDNISSIAEVEKFLRLKISTDNTTDIRRLSPNSEKDFIQCITVHKAKGLEYDHVILPKLTKPFITNKPVDVIVRNEKETVKVGYNVMLGEDKYSNNNYSNYLKDEKSEIIGEEARLLYVAMTRCKKNLYLNSAGLAATEGINNWKSLIGGARTYV